MDTEAKIISATENAGKTPVIYKVLVIFAVMSVIGGALTGVMTYINIGFSETFFTEWRNALLSAYLVMPIGFILMGLLTKLVNKRMPNTGMHTRNIITGVVMAVLMESLLSFSTAMNTIGFANQHDFFAGWLAGFAAALPLGLTIMIIMSLTIKPKLERFMKS